MATQRAWCKIERPTKKKIVLPSDATTIDKVNELLKALSGLRVTLDQGPESSADVWTISVDPECFDSSYVYGHLELGEILETGKGRRAIVLWICDMVKKYSVVSQPCPAKDAAMATIAAVRAGRVLKARNLAKASEAVLPDLSSGYKEQNPENTSPRDGNLERAKKIVRVAQQLGRYGSTRRNFNKSDLMKAYDDLVDLQDTYRRKFHWLREEDIHLQMFATLKARVSLLENEPPIAKFLAAFGRYEQALGQSAVHSAGSPPLSVGRSAAVG